MGRGHLPPALDWETSGKRVHLKGASCLALPAGKTPTRFTVPGTGCDRPCPWKPALSVSPIVTHLKQTPTPTLAIVPVQSREVCVNPGQRTAPSRPATSRPGHVP